jgi:hypothetical protein
MAMSVMIFGLDFFKIHWWHVFYVIFALVITVYGTMTLYPYGMGRAVIFAIGAVLTLYFFDERWFGTATVVPPTWPPTVNMCPDFLTFVPKVSGSKSPSGGACVDLLGVTTNGAGLQKTMPSQLNSLSATDNNKVFEYTADDLKDPKVNLQMVCDRCRIAGVTWEGVYDGDSCPGVSNAAINQDLLAKCAIDITSDINRLINRFYG